MSEDERIFKRRKRVKFMELFKKRFKVRCPVCGTHSVIRDIAPDDGYYVERCTKEVPLVENGKVTLTDQGNVVMTNCGYWGTGWE